MYTALRAGALLVITGAIAGLILIFASDPVEAPSGGEKNMNFTLTSSAFVEGDAIPARFTCDGENISPPLTIAGVPEGTVSLALIMHDPDVPKKIKPDGNFDHWVLFNINPITKEIGANDGQGTLGANGAKKNAYTGPCPPPQYEPSTHRYFFTLYALDRMLDLKVGTTKEILLTTIEGHILAQTKLMGTYKKEK